jgi:hypothetical protein
MAVWEFFREIQTCRTVQCPKTTDLVYINTDKDFKVKDVQVFEKEKSKWVNSDYLFSQYLNDGKDVVFSSAIIRKIR